MKSILAEALHAVAVGGQVWLAAGGASSATIDYHAEAMRYAFEPCVAVSAWHSGLEARLGAAEAARMLRERKAAELARAADRIVARVRGKPRAYRLGIYRAARIGCIDAVLGLGR